MHQPLATTSKSLGPCSCLQRLLQGPHLWPLDETARIREVAGLDLDEEPAFWTAWNQQGHLCKSRGGVRAAACTCQERHCATCLQVLWSGSALLSGASCAVGEE